MKIEERHLLIINQSRDVPVTVRPADDLVDDMAKHYVAKHFILKNHRGPIESIVIRPIRFGWLTWAVSIELGVLDTTNNLPCSVVVTRTVPGVMMTDLKEFGRFLSTVIKEALCHEVDETFKCDGIQVIDPHKVKL